MISGPVSRAYYPALDGLRGIASLLVVIYHNFGFIDYFFFGWLGLDIFFVLSGFLITDILLKTNDSPHFLRNFYMRRLLRVFPVYYLALIIFLIILPHVFHFIGDLQYYLDNQAWLWVYLQNWLYIFKNPDGSSLNHLWSLAVEEQFYLLWPVAFLVLKKPKHLLILISLILIFVVCFRCWIWFRGIEDLAYYNLYTFTRIDGICIGCIVALMQKIDLEFLKKNTPWIVFAFAALNFLFYYINIKNQHSFPYLAMIGYTTFAMIFGLLVYDIVNGDTAFFRKVFDIGILKFIGKISYGCYIFHWPIYVFLGPNFETWAGNEFNFISPQIASSIIATLLGYLAGWLSYELFEKIFLRWKKNYE